MEKFTQYRDRGTGVSPFLPVTEPTNLLYLLLSLLSITFRLPLLLSFLLPYTLLSPLSALPGFLSRFLNTLLLFLLGVFWTDLQVEGVRRGTLASAPPTRYPHAGSVIACVLTSPIEPLWLAAVFDPIFTISYPTHRMVRQVSLLQVVRHIFSEPVETPAKETQLVTIAELQARYPRRIVAVFPECTAHNGRGVLPLSPSVVSSRDGSFIFPITVRYQPADVVTPLPGDQWGFVFRALSHMGVRMHVRIGESVANTTEGEHGADTDVVSYDEKDVIGQVADGLARLGRVPKLGLTLQEKAAFLKAWKTR